MLLSNQIARFFGYQYCRKELSGTLIFFVQKYFLQKGNISDFNLFKPFPSMYRLTRLT